MMSGTSGVSSWNQASTKGADFQVIFSSCPVVCKMDAKTLTKLHAALSFRDEHKAIIGMAKQMCVLQYAYYLFSTYQNWLTSMGPLLRQQNMIAPVSKCLRRSRQVRGSFCWGRASP